MDHIKKKSTKPTVSNETRKLQRTPDFSFPHPPLPTNHHKASQNASHENTTKACTHTRDEFQRLIHVINHQRKKRGFQIFGPSQIWTFRLPRTKPMPEKGRRRREDSEPRENEEKPSQERRYPRERKPHKSG